ncbi:MAG: glycerate kinase type-2 family protein [Alkalispirochaeta sp.]
MNTTAADVIARAAIDRVNPSRMISSAISLQGDTLTLRTETTSFSEDLTAYQRIVVLGAGKAAAAMVHGLEQVLGDRIDDGLIVTKYEHALPLDRVRIIEAGHPVPDENSLRAGREIAACAEGLDAHTLCFTVVSGGGSALLTLPAEFGDRSVGLDDVQETTRLLLAAGAPIQAVNCVRRHLSGIAGGRFAQLVAPARTVALVLSDVVGDELESIASGLVAPDPTSYADALDACREWNILSNLPAAARELLEAGERGEIPDTPKPEDPVFATLTPVLIGTNAVAVEAARTAAEGRGYHTLVLTSQLTGEAREIAKVFSGIAGDVVRGCGPVERPACILAGGETTVTLRGEGLGGRNQEMALSVLREIAQRPSAYTGVTFLSVGTDGTDGPTDAAGAYAAPELLVGDPTGSPGAIADALARNDAYHLFQRLGGLYTTGPTNTNVCDIQVLLVE